MSFTNFPHGVTSFGAPVGAAKYAGWWGNNIWFVDDDEGMDSNKGDEPTRAVQTIQRAVDLAGPQDTIFLRPRYVGTGSYGAHGYYTGNVLTTTAQQGLQIVGTGSGGARGIGANVQVAIEPTAGSTAATVMVQSPCVSIENVLVKAITGCLFGGIAADQGAASAFGQAWGLTISNCSFKDFIGDQAYGSIDVDTIHWLTIQHCYFRQGNYGIVLGSSGAAIQGSTIRDCDFVGAASNWNADIWVGDCREISIDNCRFMHAIPSGGLPNKYIVFGGGTGTGLLSNLMFASSTEGLGGITLAGSVLNAACWGDESNPMNVD